MLVHLTKESGGVFVSHAVASVAAQVIYLPKAQSELWNLVRMETQKTSRLLQQYLILLVHEGIVMKVSPYLFLEIFKNPPTAEKLVG